MSRPGSGGIASASMSEADRRERLRLLALETVDLKNDPYFLRNHLGTFECKLCLTLHQTQDSYLAHTQGKRHQQNLARRAAKTRVDKPSNFLRKDYDIRPRKTPKIGTPGYNVVKQFDKKTRQRSLLFRINYKNIETTVTPRYRFMSAFEQKVEPYYSTDKPPYQYLLFAAEPYETVAFKIPNWEVDKSKMLESWDENRLHFTLQMFFKVKK